MSEREFPWSFADHHFVRFMDAYSDGMMRKVYMDDISFTPQDEIEAAAGWALANELDVEDGTARLELWRAYRAATPPPVPDNIVLGET